MAILGDILPQDAPAPAAANSPNANASAAQDTSQGFQLPSQMPPQVPLAQPLPGATATAVPNGKSADVAAAAASTNPAAGLVSAALARTNNAPANKAVLTPAAGPEELAAPSDPRIEIKKEAIPAARAGLSQTLNQKPAETGELAFAARIAQQTGAKAPINFNDASSAIAASRFETAGGKGFSGSRDQASSNPAATPESAPTDASSDASSLPPSQVLADSQLTAGPVTRQTASPQAESASAGVAIAGARVAAEAATPQSALPSMATASNTTSDARNASAPKAAADTPAPEFLEPPQDTPARNGESVKDISLRLSDKDQGTVQVRLSERAGELRVSVRTPDTGLTRGLRDGLTDLVGRLEHSGYKAETWQPADSSSASQDQGRQSSQDQSSRQQQGGSDSGSGQQQNARDHQQPDAQTPQWVGELESSLQRSDNRWPASLAQ